MNVADESSAVTSDAAARRRLNLVGHLFVLAMLAGFLLIPLGFVAAGCWIVMQDTIDQRPSWHAVILWGLLMLLAFGGLIVWHNRKMARIQGQAGQTMAFRRWLYSPLKMYVASSKFAFLVGLFFAGGGVWATCGGIVNLIPSTDPRPSPIPFFWAGAIFLLIGSGLAGLMVVRMLQERRGWQADLPHGGFGDPD